MSIKKIGLLTGGGDCPGLNAVIRAVTKTAINDHALEVIGIRDGFLGLIEDRVVPLDLAATSNILPIGGTILGTSNKANPKRFAVGEDADGQPLFEDVTDRVLSTIEKHGLDGIVCIGGDGTLTCAATLVEHGIPCVGVPKTIDNDVMETERTFGFDTAVQTATDALDKIHTTASSHHRVMIVELMGRNAGWLTLHAGVASGADVILIPEIPYDVSRVCDFTFSRKGHGKSFTIIAISEGAMPIGGNVTVAAVVPDSHESIRLGGVSRQLAREIADRTDLETRATILGHVQRGGTPTAYDRVLATRFGHAALELLLHGEPSRLVVLQAGEIKSAAICDIADRQRVVPLGHPLVKAARAIGTNFGDD